MKNFSIILFIFLFGCSGNYTQQEMTKINNACNDSEGLYKITYFTLSKVAYVYCKNGTLMNIKLGN